MTITSLKPWSHYLSKVVRKILELPLKVVFACNNNTFILYLLELPPPCNSILCILFFVM